VPDIDLDPARRASVVGQLQQVLGDITPTAKVTVRGSLGSGAGDRLSDIDLMLSVDADDFEPCLLAIPAALERVRSVRLLRVDPATLNAVDRRLIFVLFRELPLFWRLDLEVSTSQSSSTHALSDVPWSVPASALMNAIAAIKALVRCDEATATGLLERGFARIGVRSRPQPNSELIPVLAAACARQDPSIEDVAAEATAVCRALLGGAL